MSSTSENSAFFIAARNLYRKKILILFTLYNIYLLIKIVRNESFISVSDLFVLLWTMNVFLILYSSSIIKSLRNLNWSVWQLALHTIYFQFLTILLIKLSHTKFSLSIDEWWTHSSLIQSKVQHLLKIGCVSFPPLLKYSYWLLFSMNLNVA